MKARKLIPLIVVSTSLASCTTYKSKPGKIEHLVGTYELISYKMKKEEVSEGNDGDTTYDKKAEIGAVAYFSVDANGYGFYGYKDNSTDPKVDSVFFTFKYSEKKPQLIEAINMENGVTIVSDAHICPGCMDEPNFGFQDRWFKKSLNYTVNSGHEAFHPEIKVPYRYVEYKRISKETGLNVVNQRLGTSVTFTKPYEMKAMSGYAVYRCSPKDWSEGNKGKYEYAILDFDSYQNGEIDMIFSLKESPARQTKKVSISVAEKGKTMKIEGLGKTFYSFNNEYNKLSEGYFSSKYEDYSDSDSYSVESFDKWTNPDATLDEIIASETSSEN